MLVLVLLPIMVLLAFVFVTAYEQRRDAERDVERELRLLARLAADDAEVAIEGMRLALLGTLSGEAEIARADPGACGRVLGRILARESEWLNIGVVRPDGTVTCSARPRGEQLAAGSPAWLARAIADRDFALGELQRDPPTGRAVLVAGMPLLDARGRPERVAFIALDVAELGRLAREAQLPPHAVLSIIDDSGMILARSLEPERFVGRLLPERPLVQAAFAQREGVTTLRGLDGVRRLYAFSHVSGPSRESLFVSIGWSETDAFAAAGERLGRNLLLVSGVALAALLVSLLATRALIVRPVQGLVRATRRIAAGDLSARAAEPPARGELGELARALDEMAGALEQRRAELERTAAELRRTAEDRRRLLLRLTAAEEETRRRVAADIHDDSAQALSAVGLRLDALMEEADGSSGELLAEARSTVRLAAQRLRRLQFELRPPLLDTDGLAAALDAHLARVARDDGFSHRVIARYGDEPNPDTRAILFRIALEALSNVRKHAHASQVDVEIRRRDGGMLLRIQDDGVGFDPPLRGNGSPDGLGLVTMEERARAAGGWWRVSSSEARGSRVEFWLPDDGALLE